LRANDEPDELRRYCYWADHNPHWMRETHTKFPQNLNVWAGIIGDRILELVFLDGNLDGSTPLTLLQEDLMKALATLFPNPLDRDLPDEINRTDIHSIML
jgi:hypothetical protein